MSNIFQTVTVQQFKDYFFRDFPYAPYYQEDAVYMVGDEVYYNNRFYQSLVDDNSTTPTVGEAWKLVSDDILNYVTDQDIEKAMSQAIINANERFGSTDEERINIYLHLVAFYLVIDLKNASSGINSSYLGVIASKSVGNVSQSYAIPTFMTNSPMYSLYGQNGYGMKYMSLIAPYLATTILFSRGASTCG